jgi:uncharacterized metal-binding protein
MNSVKDGFNIKITSTDKTCPAGEKAGSRYIQEGKIPVLSCEGACIRGEIARLAAHLVAKEEPYRRACHGEFITVPGSGLAQWMHTAEKVVLIDGCFLHCHGRMLEHLVGEDKLATFDALSYYRKYTEYFDIDSVPEAERRQTARLVADSVLAELRKTSNCDASMSAKAGCGSESDTAQSSGCGCS